MAILALRSMHAKLLREIGLNENSLVWLRKLLLAGCGVGPSARVDTGYFTFPAANKYGHTVLPTTSIVLPCQHTFRVDLNLTIFAGHGTALIPTTLNWLPRP